MSTESSLARNLAFDAGPPPPHTFVPDQRLEAEEFGVMEPFLQSLLVSALLLLAELAIKVMLHRFGASPVAAA
jgi:hypothetical protein